MKLTVLRGLGCASRKCRYILFGSVFTFLIFFSFTSFTQVPSSKVLAVYGTEEYHKLSENRKAYLEYFAESGYYLIEKREVGHEKYPKLSEVALANKYVQFDRPVFNQLTFNPLMFSFRRDKNLRILYRVDGTNWVIAFYSEVELSEKLNKAQGK
jgi:hypothetical protein